MLPGPTLPPHCATTHGALGSPSSSKPPGGHSTNSPVNPYASNAGPSSTTGGVIGMFADEVSTEKISEAGMLMRVAPITLIALGLDLHSSTTSGVADHVFLYGRTDSLPVTGFFGKFPGSSAPPQRDPCDPS